MIHFLKTNPYILGNIDPQLFIAAVGFAFVGVLIVLLSGSRLRDPNSSHSPEKFSWKYLFSDNAKRIYCNILCILVTLRFMPEILNLELTVWTGLVVGIMWDGIFLIIKQKTGLLDPKKKADEK